MRAVDSLETNRAIRGDFVPLLRYLQDAELASQPTLRAAVDTTARAVLEAFLTRYLPRVAGMSFAPCRVGEVVCCFVFYECV